MSDRQWGAGSMRERRPGVWEIRIAVGVDPRTGNTLQKSVTFHRTEPEAAACRTALASARKARRSIVRPASQVTVESLLERWLAAGASPSMIAGRFRVLRSAIGWAYDERIIDDHPLRNRRDPARVRTTAPDP